MDGFLSLQFEVASLYNPKIMRVDERSKSGVGFERDLRERAGEERGFNAHETLVTKDYLLSCVEDTLSNIPRPATL